MGWDHGTAVRPFRHVWLSATTSAVGSAFVPVALAFAVLGLGGTATSLGLVLLTGTVAGLVAYLAGGVWADRVSRRNLMLLGDTARRGRTGRLGHRRRHAADHRSRGHRCFRLVPALVPAVRAVTRDSDGTITGPAPSRQMKEISS
jgi:hypothetical protein